MLYESSIYIDGCIYFHGLHKFSCRKSRKTPENDKSYIYFNILSITSILYAILYAFVAVAVAAGLLLLLLLLLLFFSILPCFSFLFICSIIFLLLCRSLCMMCVFVCAPIYNVSFIIAFALPIIYPYRVVLNTD